MIDKEDPHVDRAVKLLIPKNCFVLWNSSTIHANIGIDKKSLQELNRVTSYIAYFPKSMRSQDIYDKRSEGYHYGDNCSHFAIKHDVKRHPYGTKERYENRGFNWLSPKLTTFEYIPHERADLI